MQTPHALTVDAPAPKRIRRAVTHSRVGAHPPGGDAPAPKRIRRAVTHSRVDAHPPGGHAHATLTR
ncbi:hypothetical protein [Streptomyces sp. NPDC056527]|uniref:hypothetical protein n=1 Tax=Streptomyces sp. NPDC056527 TaxID=3345853 RepID=UPI0036B42320